MADPTSYIVLRRTSAAKSPIDAAATTGGSGDEQWERVATVQASSATAAIRSELIDLIPRDQSHAGTYVAIPARSFKPVTVTAETQTVIKIEEAK
jgi:hypothetical protein